MQRRAAAGSRPPRASRVAGMQKWSATIRASVANLLESQGLRRHAAIPNHVVSV
jgi:hypothetical protein